MDNDVRILKNHIEDLVIKFDEKKGVTVKEVEIWYDETDTPNAILTIIDKDGKEIII